MHPVSLGLLGAKRLNISESSISIHAAYSNLHVLSKEKQPEDKAESQASKVANWPLLCPVALLSASRPSCKMLKITISLLSQEILKEIQRVAGMTELCRSQHRLLAVQEQALGALSWGCLRGFTTEHPIFIYPESVLVFHSWSTVWAQRMVL